MSDAKYAIYALCDPDEPDTVRYIGLTVNVEERFKDHCKYSDSISPKSQWIQGLRDKNIKPICKVIEEQIQTETEARFREAFWILRYRRMNMPLTNVPISFNKVARLYESLDYLISCGEPSEHDLEDEDLARFWIPLSWKERNSAHIIRRAQEAGTWAGERWKTIFDHTGKTCDQLLGMSLYNHAWNQVYSWLGHIHSYPMRDAFSRVLNRTTQDSSTDEKYYDEQLAFVESFILCFPREWFTSSEWKELDDIPPPSMFSATYTMPKLSDLDNSGVGVK